MLQRLSSLRAFRPSAKILPMRNMSIIGDTIRNIIPIDTTSTFINASKSGIVSTVTGKAYQKIKDKDETNSNKEEGNENDKNAEKIKLNYPKFLLVGINNLISMCLFDWGIFKITQDKDKMSKKSKELYSKTKETLNSRDEVQEYIPFSNDDDVCGNYKGSFKNIKDTLLSANLKVKNYIKNLHKMPFPNEIYPSTPHMLYRSLCCQNIKLNDFKEAYSDIKNSALDKDSKFHFGLNKISTALVFELIYQLAQNNMFGKFMTSVNFLPKSPNDGIFKTLTQNIIINFKKLFLVNGIQVAIKNLGSNNGEDKEENQEVNKEENQNVNKEENKEENKPKKPDSD